MLELNFNTTTSSSVLTLRVSAESENELRVKLKALFSSMLEVLPLICVSDLFDLIEDNYSNDCLEDFISRVKSGNNPYCSDDCSCNPHVTIEDLSCGQSLDTSPRN